MTAAEFDPRVRKLAGQFTLRRDQWITPEGRARFAIESIEAAAWSWSTRPTPNPTRVTP